MKTKTFLIFTIVIIFAACGGQREKETLVAETTSVVLGDTEQVFLNNLASLCGQSFAGKETFIEEGRESWADKKMVMHVTVCDEDKVHIPFHVNEDKSRTWMFLVEDGKLRFRHDHRHEDGTPEDQTLYGGYSDGKGSDLMQCFPEDEYTKEHLDGDFVRQWNVILSAEMSTFSYELFRDDILVFVVEFDLTKPL